VTLPALTVLGGSGFIGRHLVRHLREAGHPCDAPARGQDLRGRDLGHVIFCVGLTADFRTRPYEAVDAHVGALLELVRACTFESLVYLSSTRVYKRQPQPVAREEDVLHVSPLVFDDLYGLSKMMGESIALASAGRVHVVRLSNVYGDDFAPQGFLSAILNEALTAGSITLQTSPETARDYVRVTDVVKIVSRIALDGKSRVYNVASGINVTNAELSAAVASLTGCRVAVQPGAETVRFPQIDIDRIRTEFGVAPAGILDDLPGLVESYRHHWRDRVLD
jgi:nucleoside-diphosphate-sugar epimerase